MSASPQVIPEHVAAADPPALLLMEPMTPGDVAADPVAFDSTAALEGARTIDGAFRLVAARRGAHPALVTAAGVFSCQQLAAAAGAVRDTLTGDPRFQRGDCVLLLLSNGPCFPSALYGVLSAGGVAVPLPADLEPDRLDHVQRRVGCRLIISEEGLSSRRGDLRPCARVAVTGAGAGAGVARSTSSDQPCIEAGPDDLALILFTSGSSGEPKGVMLSHRNVLANTRYIWNHLPIAAEDRALCLSPCCHAFGHGVMQSHFLRGATLIFDGSLLFPSSIVDAIKTHEATSLAAVPDAYRFLLRRTTFSHALASSLRYASTAGAPLSAGEAAEIARRFAPARFFTLYGQTESTSRICVHAGEDFEAHPGSIGRGGPDIEVEVVDETGHLVAPGCTGEVRARADNIMMGYWRDAAATRRVLRNGWLYTGDLATTDEDGFIYLHGRADHLVKIGGHRVSLDEIEGLARERLSGTEAVAVTFETPDGATRLGLFLQAPHEGEQWTSRDAWHALRSDLPRHKAPFVVEVLESFPRTASMKVDRMALARRAASLAAGSSTIP